MKNLILPFIAIMLSIPSFAQRTGDVTIYSNTGERFFVIMNGIRQNQDAETNVKITGLTNDWYSCRILAEDKSFDIEKNIIVKKDSIVTYRIIKKGKKKFKMRYYSETALNTAPQVADQTTIVYHPTENFNQNNTTTQTDYLPGSRQGGGTGGGNQDGTGGGNRAGSQTTVSGNQTTVGGNQQMGGSSTTVTTTTSTTTTASGTNTTVNGNTNGTGNTNVGGNVSIGIQVDENGNMSTSTSAGSNGEQVNIDMNVNVNGNGMGIENNNTTTTYEETTVTTTTTTNTSSNDQFGTTTSTNGQVNTNNTTQIYQDQDVAVTSSGGCGTTDADIIAIKKAIEAEAFAEDQMIMAKGFAQNHCMTTEQIREITMLFDFSEDRLTFLKACYLNCLNQTDYYQLSNVFDFTDDKKALQSFIDAQ